MSKNTVYLSRRTRDNSGVALIISLALIVLITAVVLAFFARATANRVTEAARANSIKTQQLSFTANDYLIAQYLQEISANSEKTTTNGVTIYKPLSAENAIPQRSLASGAMANNTNFVNLVRQSVSGADTNASGHATTTPSKNKRFISATRWATPRLIFTSFATNELPNWIYVNKDGTSTSSASTNAIGRFAYNVYDIGGLLNANVAGYRPDLTSQQINILKSSVAGTDLTRIGLSDASINGFIENFRNYPAASTAATYTNIVMLASTNGFNTSSNYNYLISRQDLIRYAERVDPNFSVALPYLTHFSRSLNAPSWGPTTPNTPNFFIPNIRVSTGQPLLKSRFPLSQLANLQSTNYFGLSGSAPLWSYTPPIATLDQVAQENRGPNFFEVLKAAILTGSLGQFGTGAVWDSSTEDQNTDLHIMRIGANIIDQFDADSTPTRITFGSSEAIGIESLPYINKFIVSASANGNIELRVELWNPHQGASANTMIVTQKTPPSGMVTINGVPTPVSLSASAATITSQNATFGEPQQISDPPFLLGTGVGQSVGSTYTLTFASAVDLGSYELTTADGKIVQSTGKIILNSNDYNGPIVLRRIDPRGMRFAGSLELGAGSYTLLPSGVTIDSSGVHYADKDGITRQADTPTSDAFAATVANRPEFLNRPFRTVGELSYVFRDLPWKTLDFNSANSGDAGLLDFFSAIESSAQISSGKISANTRQPVVVAALLSNALQTDAATTLPLSDSPLNTAATSYTDITSIPANSFLNPASIATGYGPTWNTASPKVKREVAARALGEAVQTRTWNLLADVIVQAGRFPTTAVGPADFLAEGEYRTWMSMAIDRYTGQLVERQIEPVNE